ncbi:MAG: hypothetical protein MUF79_07020 [Burkholderiales bacterium]|jgi:hypothetical protein|nr:hypothetical protein [Burkholderiales bacterium]
MKHWGRSVAWWYWLATVALLGAALSLPSAPAMALVVALTAFQATHFRIRTGDWRAFPVQVRAAFLVLLLAGLWPPLGFVNWLQLAGTAVRVVFDYCALARTMSLMPWNRSAPLGLAALRHAYLMPPSQWRFAGSVRRSGDAGEISSQTPGRGA